MAAGSSPLRALASRRVRAAALIVTVGLSTTAPAGAAAADDGGLLPGSTLAIVPVDLDGDGADELVRTVGTAVSGTDLEIWELDDGRWTATGSTPFAEPRSSSIATLLPWRLDGRVHALALSAQASPDGDAACCLEVSLVERAADGAPVPRSLEIAGDGRATSMHALDMDADGTDELLLESLFFGEPDSSGEPLYRLEVLAWDGRRFELLYEALDEWYLASLPGDSDAVPGDDILLSRRTDGVYVRLSMADDEIVTEPPGGELLGRDSWPLGVVAGRLVAQTSSTLSVIRWPRDGDPQVVASTEIDDLSSAWILGSGEDAMVVVASRAGVGAVVSGILLLDLDLVPIAEIEPPAAARELPLIGQGTFDTVYWYPFLGPLTTMPDGAAEAIVAAGMLIEPGGPDRYTASPFSPMAGKVPLAAAGPDDAWVVVADSYEGPYPGPGAYLYPEWSASELAYRVRILRRDSLAALDPDPDTVDVVLEGAVELGRNGRHRELIAAPGGFTATVAAPAGARAVIGGPTTSDEVAVGNGAPRMTVRGPNRDRDVPFERWLLVVLPDGRFVLEEWSGVFVGGEMDLTVDAHTEAFRLGATLSGRTVPQAVVTAGGRSTVADNDGRFELRVGAAPWPESLLVTAADPFDRSTSGRVEVIGFLDYRGLPWALILGVLGVVAGVVLYLRPPRREPAPELGPEGGTLEEIDG